MTSILTNLSSMTALQTLKGINKSLNTVQGEVSSGLKIANSKDNASVWAIAATMRSDVASFKQINDGLGAALAAVNVGRNAAETVTDLVTKIKEKVNAAATIGINTGSLQDDIEGLIATIGSVVEAASFNGVNFVNNATAVDVLTSVDRVDSDTSDDKYLPVASVDLRVGNGAAPAVRGGLAGSAGVATGDDLAAFSMAAGFNLADGTTTLVIADTLQAGDTVAITIGDRTASYTLTATDVAATSTNDVVAQKLKSAIEGLGLAGVTVDYDIGTPGGLILGNDGTGNVARSVAAVVVPVDSGGGLSALHLIDVETNTLSRTAALGILDVAMATVINATAALGSNQARLEIQQEFISKLSDSLTVGISALVDADMEEASARLAALQTQQQLGIQSLSIANQSPQSIMALFR